LIASGLEGIKHSQDLVWKDFYGNPSKVDETTRIEFGIQRRLPHDLHESLRLVREFDWRELGLERAVSRFEEMKRQEIIDLKQLTDEERRALMIRHF